MKTNSRFDRHLAGKGNQLLGLGRSKIKITIKKRMGDQDYDYDEADEK